MHHKLRSVIKRLYTGLLFFYPRRFRADFGDELQDIFSKVVDEAEAAGIFELLTIFFNELRSLVVSIVQEHWFELRSSKEKKMAPNNDLGVVQDGGASLSIVESSGLRWILRWILLMTAAILAGWLLMAPFTALLLTIAKLGGNVGILSSINDGNLELVGLFIGLALSYATAQWLMLRRYLPRPKSWFLSTSVGLLIAGIILGIVVSISNNLFLNPSWGKFVFFPLIGVVVGIAQWAVLRKVLQNAFWILTIDFLAASSFLLSGRAITSFIELLIILILPGLITGVGIWVLLKYSQPVEKVEEREISQVRTKKRTKKWLWIFAGLVSLIPLFFAYCWLHATSHIALAKNEGIYATVEEAVIARNSQGWGGAQVVKIEDVRASPNSWDGSQPHVWFGGGRVYLDRVPQGSNRTQYLAGSYYIHVREGWVHVPEGAFPEFIGWIMELYDLEGVNEWIQENST